MIVHLRAGQTMCCRRGFVVVLRRKIKTDDKMGFVIRQCTNGHLQHISLVFPPTLSSCTLLSSFFYLFSFLSHVACLCVCVIVFMHHWIIFASARVHFL